MRRGNVRNIGRWAAPVAGAIILANVQLAWSDRGLTGEVRTTFVEAYEKLAKYDLVSASDTQRGTPRIAA